MVFLKIKLIIDVLIDNFTSIKYLKNIIDYIFFYCNHKIQYKIPSVIYSLAIHIYMHVNL